MTTTVCYNISDGEMVGYTTMDPYDATQIPDPLPAGLAVKQVADINGLPADPGRPPAGFTLAWNVGTLEFDQVAVPPTPLQPHEFWGRFTSDEREEFLEMSVNGTANQQKKIRAFRDYTIMFQSFALDDQYIIDSVNLMESAGVLGAGRAAQILAV